jgi:hypothetical protein
MDEENAGIDGDTSDVAPAPADEPASEADPVRKPEQRSAPRGWWWLPHPGPGPDGFYGSGF